MRFRKALEHNLDSTTIGIETFEVMDALRSNWK